MRVWRISRHRHAADLKGLGGLVASGRWHHPGKPILYTSATPSLAALEVLVHVDSTLAPPDLALIEIVIPDDIAIEYCNPVSLTPSWQTYPGPVELQDFGSMWLAEIRSAILAVPSAVLPVEQNYLINPLHPEIARLRVVQELPFYFDPRLMPANRRRHRKSSP